MPKCHVTGNYVEWEKDCADCHTRSCPINTGFAENPHDDDEKTLKQKSEREGTAEN